ncbi:adenosylcobyric acid synthase (glutamine-hydrolysing) [Natronincola peptidivorans]|uniref:Cobyric acid synthase n=1 Tax=Natronincola peptidivorans TaxID=426128 RepID=A0A1I0DJA0_9FIRM|nr:cobyric acid synthase [Natronincola peptidivorans]SET32514.1 adenosylcobyric acid synthase (glutamine-hydrolysing) [Natronincola peptidivorans]
MKKGKNIMLQGTASSVGKSLLTAAFCRIFQQDGYKVVPFKSQNMALNSFITEEGLEMGRAQVFQAEAAKVKPSASMNPILLKPTGDAFAQVIIKGKVYNNMTAVEYHDFKPQLKNMIQEIYQELSSNNDIVVIEGAGSPAEINLRDKDIVNMGMAEIADSPVLLIGDIDRGGVFASLYGTIMLLREEERKRVKGILINKFRGDKSILAPGLKMLEDLTGIPVLGVIPYGNFNIEDEDSVTQRFQKNINQEGKVTVEVIRLPHISNFTDFHVFEILPDVNIRYITERDSIDYPDIVIIPGSKNTISDLKYLRESGLEKEIIKAYKNGSYIIGICGGYQMLGRKVLDPQGVESSMPQIRGLGLLDVETIFEGEKVTTQVQAEVIFENKGILNRCKNSTIKGYEIHMGRTKLGKDAEPLLKITEKLGKETEYTDGAVDREGRVFGTYIHGIFDEISFTEKIIGNILKKKGLAPSTQQQISLEQYKDNEYQKLANLVRENIDLQKIYEILEG